MDDESERSIDFRRSRNRPANSSSDDRVEYSIGRVGCSLVSVAATAIVFALAATGMLDQSVTWVRTMIGGGVAKSEVAMSNNCRQLVAALKLYAGDHNDSYPDSLFDLVPEPLSETELNRLLGEGTANEGSAPSAWILTPHLTTSSSAADILIISARPTGKKHHIAGLNDGSVVPISIEAAEAHLSRLGQ